MSVPEHFLTRRDRWKDLVASQKLSAIALRLALVLSSRFNEKQDGCAFVSIDTAAAVMAVSRSSAKRALKELQAFGLMDVTVRKGHATNLFAMAFEPIPEAKRQSIIMNRLSAKETVQKPGVLGGETVQHVDPQSVRDQLEDGAALKADPIQVALGSTVVDVSFPDGLVAAGRDVTTRPDPIASEAEPLPADTVGTGSIVAPSSDKETVETDDDEEDDVRSYAQRVGELRDLVRQMSADRTPMPYVLIDWLEDDHDLIDEKLEHFEEMADSAFEDERQRLVEAEAEAELQAEADRAAQEVEIEHGAHAPVSLNLLVGQAPIHIVPVQAGTIKLDERELEVLLNAPPPPCGSAKTMVADRSRVFAFASNLLRKTHRLPSDERADFFRAQLRRVENALCGEGVGRNDAIRSAATITAAVDQLVAARAGRAVEEATSEATRPTQRGNRNG